MSPFISPFDVRDNIRRYGKAYAFYEARRDIGTVKALYFMWVAIHMTKYQMHTI